MADLGHVIALTLYQPQQAKSKTNLSTDLYMAKKALDGKTSDDVNSCKKVPYISRN